MKKSFLLLSGVAMMMTACSSDDVIEQAPTKVIGFDTFVNNSTRATANQDVSNSTLEDFLVWGVTYNGSEAPSAIFQAQPVNKNTTTTVAWEYSPLRYWVAGNNYRFSAIAPASACTTTPAPLTVTQNTDAITDLTASTGGIALSFDNSQANAAVDLCFATNYVVNAAADQSAVTMQFSHLLSRVKFTFTNSFSSDNSLIKVKDIKITDATAKASIDKHAGATAWTASTDAPGTFEINFTRIVPSAIANGIAPNGSMETEHQYIFPLTSAAIYHVSFTVELINYDQKSETYTTMATYKHLKVALPEITYACNFSYNFVADINPNTIDPENTLNPIQFTPEVTPWGKFNDEVVEGYEPATPAE